MIHPLEPTHETDARPDDALAAEPALAVLALIRGPWTPAYVAMQTESGLLLLRISL